MKRALLASSIGPVFWLVGVAALLGGTAWTIRRGWADSSNKMSDTFLVFSAEPLSLPEIAETPEAAGAEWLSPATPRRGAEWACDLFAPAKLYRTSEPRWSVSPLLAKASEQSMAVSTDEFLIKADAIGRAVSPVQLVGFACRDDLCLGTFENARTREVFLAKNGQRIDELNIWIRSLSVERRAGFGPSGESLVGRVAVARVECLDSGGLQTLTSGERDYTGDIAVRLIRNDSGETRWARLGESWKCAERDYTVLKIDLVSSQVRVRRESEGTAPAQEKTFTVPTQRMVSGDGPFVPPVSPSISLTSVTLDHESP